MTDSPDSPFDDTERVTSIDDLMAGPDEVSESEMEEAAAVIREADPEVIVKIAELLEAT